MSYSNLISVDQLAAELPSPDCVVVDCRFALGDPGEGRKQYDAAHLPGARYAHLDDDLSSPITAQSGRHPLPDADTFCQRLGAWGIRPGTQVIAYDDSGGAFASRLWWLMRWVGCQTTAVLDGGYSAWAASGHEVTNETPEIDACEFPANADDSLWLTSKAVVSGVKDGSFTLVDAREAERYRGEMEPIDPVAGRVPGAVNRPFKGNVDSSGRFLPAEELRRRFESLTRDGGQTVHMCGSGVTACHNMLAMEAAGLCSGRLYAGSWSEWIRDPSRAVATGE